MKLAVHFSARGRSGGTGKQAGSFSLLPVGLVGIKRFAVCGVTEVFAGLLTWMNEDDTHQ